VTGVELNEMAEIRLSAPHTHVGTHWHPKPGNVLNLFRLSIQLPPLYSPAPFLRTPIAASIMDSDALYPSSLSSVYQPLDVLRLELQDEPAYLESDLPKDDHTLTFVSSRLVPSIL
jgi:hypothetical protein